ncbi:response regulator [Pseudoalteromonas sp. JBTF-M23]|uniref:Sensory/regulatory protein RpfC n=1 Tax=Pseudoalteromonas caenipelagi TaxID=2726988 RepID=A0A849VBB6_9GAMM|nr:ATP-binding protein [Pseudoalteromonas caenipelagi]NOU50070.1 response regulator [Pseudoalteromonas caenipelagi]
MKKLLCFTLLLGCFYVLDSISEQYYLERENLKMHQQVQINSEQFVLIGDVIFSLQRERGTTSVFHVHNKSAPPPLLLKYQHETDQYFRQIIRFYNQEEYVISHGNTIEILNSYHQQVATIREQISTLQITKSESFSQYTNVIESLLDTVLAIKHKTFVGYNESHIFYPDLSIYLSLLKAIEHAGKLRANVGVYLNSPTVQKNQIIPKIFYLNANLNHVLTNLYVTESLKESIQKIESSKEKTQILNLINTLRVKGQAHMPPNLWWEVSTRYINELTALSAKIISSGQTLARDHIRTTSLKCQVILITFIAVTVVGGILTYSMWLLMKPNEIHRNTAVSYWQLSFVLFSILLVMLLAHKVSQRGLEGQLKRQLTAELRNNAVHTLKSVKAIWYRPAKNALASVQSALFTLTKAQIEDPTILSGYISNPNVAIYDTLNQVWLHNGNEKLTLALEQTKHQQSLAEQGKVIVSTVLSDNKLSAHFATQLLNEQGILPYQVWYSLDNISPLISILKSPFLDSDSNIIYFDKNNIITHRSVYANQQQSNEDNIAASTKVLRPPMTERQYKNYLGKQVLGVLVWDNELSIGVGAEQEIVSINAVIKSVQQEFSIQLLILLSLGGAILLIAYRVQSKAFTQLAHSEQQLEKDKIQLNNAQKIANMGSWEWRYGNTHVDVSKELSNMLTLPSETRHYPARSLLRLITPSSRHELLQAIKDHSSLKSITLQLTTQNLPYITHVGFAANWQLSEQDKHDPTNKTLVGIIKNVTLLVMEQNRQQRQQTALRAAREAALAKMEEADQQRKALEIALKENKETERLLQQTLDSIPAFILLLDSNANITLVNQYWFKTQHADQFSGGLFLNTFFNVGDDCIDAINTLPLIKKKPLLDALREAKFQDNYLAELECEYAITEGPIWFEVIITTIETLNGKSILMYQHDITQRKQDAFQLEDAKAKAELANDAKSRFLATMSHEIRTPMNGVVGMLDLLNQSKLSQEQSHLTSVAKNSALMLLRIINDILDFSKIEAGKMTIDRVPFNWRGVIKEIAELLSHQVKEKNLQMYFMFEPELGYWQLGDPSRIRQILLNLVGNAVKFTKTSSSKIGVIEIKLSKSQVDPKQLEISVIDNGKGMSNEQQKLLFKPFTQADSSIQREFGGTGLGLSITQKLVTMMQGSIMCQSSENIGSTFKVTLPYSKCSSKSEREIEIVFDSVSVCILGDGDIFEQDLHTNLLAHGADSKVVNWININDTNVQALNVDYVVVTLERYQQIITANYQFKPDNNKTCYIILVSNNFTVPLPTESCFDPIYYNPYYSFKIIEHIAIREGIISPDIPLTQLVNNDELALPTIEQAQQNNQLILVVEDNAYNQEVFRRQLSLLGYQCMIAEHGQMALEFIETHSFALIITDCHMPIMDGYTFTKKYRELEKQNSVKKAIPIIAATANALSGEREKCIACGMNDYISKPIELAYFKNLLLKWMPSASATNNIPPKVNNKVKNNNHKTLDLSLLSTYVGDDTKIQQAFLESFINDSNPMMDKLYESPEDIESVRSLTHQLKSSAKAIGAVELANLYLELELAAKEQHTDKIADMLPHCASQFNAVCSEITSILNHSDLH